jgi:hypothetical protein
MFRVYAMKIQPSRVMSNSSLSKDASMIRNARISRRRTIRLPSAGGERPLCGRRADRHLGHRVRARCTRDRYHLSATTCLARTLRHSSLRISRISHRDALERNARLCGSDDPARRVVSVHLGSGCSIVAGRGRFIIDSTMGMTPMEGLMMGSRSGSIDPGIIFTLLRRGAIGKDELERTLLKESGLAGVSV